MREAELHYVVGSRGTGKTTTGKAVAAHLLRARRKAGLPGRLVVFDPAEGRPQDEWRPAGATYARGRAAFLEALAASRFPIVVKPPIFLDWSPLERMKELVIVVDEAHRFQSARGIHPSLKILVAEGRHRSVDLVIVTQRPAQLHGDVLANPTAAWVHPLRTAADREALERGLDLSLRGRTWKRVPGTLGATFPIRLPEDEEPEIERVSKPRN